jgi:hypothetical protein
MSFDFSQLLVADTLIASGVMAGVFVFNYTIGKYSVVPTIAALGMAAALSVLVPYVGRVPGVSVWPTYQQQMLAFGVFLIVSYVTFRRHSYFEPSVIPSMTELAVCSVVMAGFVLAVMGSFLPADVVATLSAHTRAIFVGDLSRTLWLLSPMVAFGVTRGR